MTVSIEEKLFEEMKLKELSKEHINSLELLDFFHKVCLENNIIYSIVGNNLFNVAGYRDFKASIPRIKVAMLYEHYQKLKKIFAEKSNEFADYIWVDIDNTKHFDFLNAWLVKRGNVRLPADRKDDEIYYHTRLVINPIYYAGDTIRGYRELLKLYKLAVKATWVRHKVPHRRLYIKIRFCVKIIINYFNLKLRGKYSIKQFKNLLEKNIEPTNFLFGYFAGEKIILNRDWFLNVKTVQIDGINCYVSEDVEQILHECYTEKQIEKIKEDKPISHLKLKGREFLRRIQLVQLDILVEFDRICRKHNLRYNIAFGTLLGAVRHKGFIPWDDDVDVLMPYEDYIKLDMAMEQDLDKEKYFLRSQESELDCNITYKHLKRNGTVYARPGRTEFNFHKGIFIDIFPLFIGFNSKILHLVQGRICHFLRSATWAYMGAETEKKFFKRLYYKLLAKIGNKRSYSLFLRFATMCKQKTGKRVYLGAGIRFPFNEAFARDSAFENMVELEFEGHKFFAPKEYDKALEFAFGKDYMMYPASRSPQHFAMVDCGNLFLFNKDEK